MAKYAYPAIFELEDGMYNVCFPDIPECYTYGDDLTDALYMAEDALGGWLSRAEEKSRSIPSASELNAVCSDGCMVALVLADTDLYRKKHSSKTIKNTLTISSWLNEAAESRNVNFSQVLQDALCNQLGFSVE